MQMVFSILLLLFGVVVRSQDTPLIRIKQILKPGIPLNKGWKFHAGDNSAWAAPDFDEGYWTSLNINEPATQFLAKTKGGICWLRLHFTMDPVLQNKSISLALNQYGASEVYVDGQFIQRYGTLSSDAVIPFNPHNNPLPLLLNGQSDHVLAIRFACPIPSPFWVLQKARIAPVTVTLQPTVASISNLQADWKRSRREYGIMCINVVFGFLFLFIFFFYRRQPLNLFFGLQNFSVALLSYFSLLLKEGQYGLKGYVFLQLGLDFFGRAAGATVMMFILQALYPRVHPFFKWFLIYLLTIAFVLFNFFPRQYALLDHCHHIIFMFILLWLSIRAFRNANLKDWFIGIMAFTSFLVNVDFFLNLFWGINLSRYAFLYPIIVLPSMIIYLALKYAQANTSLERQLVQVKKLSEENLRSEQEKKHILVAQNETLEKQVVERTDALQKSLQNLKDTQKQLVQSEKMASLGELTAGIAHEIQNPLNFVNNFSETNAELIGELKNEIRSGHLKEALAIAEDVEQNEFKVVHHGKRADAIVKNMLEHSRTSKGEKQVIDINALTDEYLRLAYHGFRAKDKHFNATIQTYFDQSLEKINIVPQDIGRVLLNLFNNAFYSVQKKKQQRNGAYEPTVIVSTQKMNDRIEIMIQDNGTGIPQNVVDKIFQPFFTTKPTGEGTGLGLSLSYDIVTQGHNGTIKVESKEGDGSVFTILLPLH